MIFYLSSFISMKKTSFFLLLIFLSCSKDDTITSEPEPVSIPKYTVTIKAGDGGTVSTAGGTYNKDSEVSVTANPNAEYLFQAWSDGSTDNPRTIKVGVDLTITANFAKKQYDLTVTVVGEGAVAEEVVIQGGRYNSGSQIKLTATAAEGWEFENWSGAVDLTDNPITVNIDAVKDVTATFTRKKFDLTVTIEGEGTVNKEVVVQPGQYDYETQVKLTAIPEEGWEFSSWTGDLESTDNPVTVTINESIEIAIIFVMKDTDGDGVPDLNDNCPDSLNNAVDENGCPLPPIRLHSNGITIVAEEWAKIGDTAEINSTTYTIVDESTLRQMVKDKSDISKVCTSRITNMRGLLAYTEFNRDISSWDVSNVTDMSEMFIRSYFDGDISFWNVSNVENMFSMFSATFFAGDVSKWDVSSVQDMSYIFSGAVVNTSDIIIASFNGDISSWNVSNVTNMRGMFYRSKFTGDISEWDTYSVKDMSLMFSQSEFNGDISNWDVSNAENMSGMFMGINSKPQVKSNFNNDISNWDVSNVKDMSVMFHSSIFNGDISNWNVSNVTDMSGMFSASEFNKDISKWDVSKVKDMSSMFGGSMFTSDISQWNVSNVTDMLGMFSTSQFNGDISKWDVSNVISMYGMFAGLNSPQNGIIQSVFNGDISNWNVSNVTDMSAMFIYSSFNQDISKWDVSNVRKMFIMFTNSQFNQNLSQWNVVRVIECQGFSQNNPQWTLPKPNFLSCDPTDLF